MTCDQITGAVVEDLKIANEIAHVFICAWQGNLTIFSR